MDDNASSVFGDAFVNLLRQVIREEIQAASNGHGYELLTAEQLAKMLRVNKATVYEWVKSKSIPFYQAGRFVRFNLQEVLESQRKKNENPP
jgi:excisionase family DNA binding protein